MIALRTVALVVRFLLELGLLIGAGTIALALLPPSIGWIVGLAAVGAVATV